MPKSELTWRVISGAMGAFAMWAAMSGHQDKAALRGALKDAEAQVAFTEIKAAATTGATERFYKHKGMLVRAKLVEDAKLEDIVASNEQVKAWADEPVPADVVIWVRDSPNKVRSGGDTAGSAGGLPRN